MFLRIILTIFLLKSYSIVCYAQEKKTTIEKKKESSDKKCFEGVASFYSDSFEGKETASGEIFSQKKLTAACNILPLGTYVTVTNLKNGKKVKVKI